MPTLTPEATPVPEPSALDYGHDQMPQQKSSSRRLTQDDTPAAPDPEQSTANVPQQVSGDFGK